ncbi:hypothetical protein HAX54_010689 [Datura stramonium]|uniref:Uncharacterized protein n=1 Tax=Datura stramonium TaxID=4076 RepID=A0ABS8TIJ7_DATST|nr:hypothetical protein [Datura stramonium]
MVDEAHVAPLELEYSIPNNQESGDTFTNENVAAQPNPNKIVAPQTSTAETVDPVERFDGPAVDDGSDVHEENTKRNEGVRPSTATSNISGVSIPSAKPRGRSRKNTTTSKTPPRPRGRSRKKLFTSEVPPAPRGKPRNDTSNVVATPTPRPRGRPRKDTNVASTSNAPLRPRGSPRPAETTTPSSPSPAAVPRKDTSGFSTYPNKRVKMVGMGVFVVESRYTYLNHGMRTSRVLNIGGKQTTKGPIRSGEVTGELGFKSRTGMRWKGQKALTRTMLEHIRMEKMHNSFTSKGKEPLC